MVNIKDLNQRIQTSKWDETNKQKMLSLLPNFGENFLFFVYNESHKLGFEYLAKYLTEATEEMSRAQQVMRQGNYQQAIEILENAPTDNFKEYGQYNLPWVLDLEQLIKNRKLTPSIPMREALLDFELAMFEYLPPQNVQDLLSNYAATIVKKKVNLLLFLKHYIYIKNWQEDAAIVKPFVDALFANKEILISDDIEEFFEKKVPGSLGNILRDFNSSFVSSGSQKISFNISKYIISKKVVKSLDNENRDILLKILEIYSWLLRPIVTASEVGLENFEENIVSNENDFKDQYINNQKFKLPQEVLQPAMAKSPPIAPVPKNAPSLRPMGDVGQISNNKFQIINSPEKNNFPKPPAVPNANAGLSSLPKKPINPLPQIRPGLSMRVPNSPQIPKKENPTENVQAKIDKKLEDLEKRAEN